MGKYFKHSEASFIQAFRTKTKCDYCDETNDIWLCLTCLSCFCSREGGGHGLKHFSDTGHCVILSLVTLNFWCYAEECYLEHDFYPVLVPLFRKFHEIRHGEQPPMISMVDEAVVSTTTNGKCPHVKSCVTIELPPNIEAFNQMRCKSCGNADETWLCLKCFECHCSRFANKHMIEHTAKTGHELCINCKDMSIWCQQCATYLDTFRHPKLATVYQLLYKLKEDQQPLPEALLTSNKRFFHDEFSQQQEEGWFNEYPILLDEDEAATSSLSRSGSTGL